MTTTETKIQKVKLAMLAMQRRPWEQGVAAQALLELGDYDTMLLLAKDSAYLQIADGRLAMPDVSHAVTDPAVNGVAVLKASELTGDTELARSVQRMADYLLHTAPRTPDGILHHNAPTPELWIDSAYMAPPFLADVGYPTEAVHQLKGLKRYLWHPEKQLFSHIWHDGNKAFTREDCWGVGNGMGCCWHSAGDCHPTAIHDGRTPMANREPTTSS